MKTFTKHILLLALMLFGALGASAKVYTTLQVGDVIHVGDQFNPGEYSRIVFDGWSYNCNPGQNTPLTLVRANLDPYLEPGQEVNVTESETGDYYVFKIGNNNYYYTEEVRISTTENSDGLVVTSASVQYNAPYIVFAVHEFDPTVPALDELTGNWNFLMPGSNKVVKAVLLDSIVLGPHVSVAVQPVQAFISYTRPGIGGDSTVLYYDPTLANSSFGFIANDDDGQGRNFAFWADDQNNHNTDRDFGGFSELTCGQRFVAVYPENHTLTLLREGYGTLKLDGVRVDTFYNITFEHDGSSGDNRSFTIPASRLPYDTTFNYDEDIYPASVNEPSGNLSIINQGARTVTISISGAFIEHDGSYSCMFLSEDHDNWTITCEDNIVPVTPYGISKTGNGTYSVMEGLTVNVTATPDSAHYLSAIGNEAVISNSAYNISFTMPDDDAELAATFTTKPTLTLAQTDGGTLEAIVPQGGVTAMHLTTDQISTWDGVAEYAMAADLQQFGFVAVDSAAAAAWTGVPASGQVLLVYALAGNSFKAIIFQDGQWYGTYTANFFKTEIYAYTNADMIYFTTGASKSNVIASSTPNTYYIDYGTPVTVVATPDAQHYLVSFSDDAPATERNSNLAVEKTYDSVIADNITLSANFQAKPTLTLTHNDGGTLTLDGYTPGEVTYNINADGNNFSNVSFPYQTTINFGDFLDVNVPASPLSIVSMNDMTGDVTISISEPFEGSKTITYWYDGEEEPLTGTKTITCTANETPAVLPAGVVSANATLDTFVVDYGTELTVTATPEVHYHLEGWSSNVTDNGDSTASLTMTQNETVSATFAQNAPELAWEYDNVILANGDTLSAYHGFEMDTIAKLIFSSNDEFYDAYMNALQNPGTSLLRFGSSNTNVVSFANPFDPQSLSVNGPGTATVYMVHDGSVMAYDSAYFTAVILAPDTLTLVHNDGGEMTVELGSATVWNSETWAGWPNQAGIEKTIGDITLLGGESTYLFDNNGNLGIGVMGGGMLPGSSPLTISTTGNNFTRIEMTMTEPASTGDRPKPNITPADGWTVTPGSTLAVWEGNANTITFSSCTTSVSQMVFYRSGANSADSIRAIVADTTYAVVPGANVTVKATPDSAHYLVNWDNDAAIYSNTDTTKHYVVNGNVTSTATFNAKPVLTLAANDTTWGKVTLGGYSPVGLSIEQLSVPSNWNDDWDDVLTSDMPTDFQTVDYLVARTWQNTTGKNVFLIFDEDEGKVVSYYVYADGTYDEIIGNPAKTQLVNHVDNGGLVFYTTGVIPGGMPAGVAQLTDSTYRVDYGTTLTVQADATELHHVANWEDQNGDPLQTATYSAYFVNQPEPLFPDSSSLTFTVTTDTVARAMFYLNYYKLTFAHNEGGTMEFVIPQDSMSFLGITDKNVSRGSISIEADSADADGMFVKSGMSDIDIVIADASITQVDFHVTNGTNLVSNYLSVAGCPECVITTTTNNEYGSIKGLDTNHVTIKSSAVYDLQIDQFTVHYGRALPEGAIYGPDSNSYYILPDSTVTVRAIPADGHYLVRWSNNATVIDTLSASITMGKDDTLTATFAPNPVITLAVNDPAMGSVYFTGYHGNTITRAGIIKAESIALPYNWYEASDILEIQGGDSMVTKDATGHYLYVNGIFAGTATVVTSTGAFSVTCEPTLPNGVRYNVAERSYTVMPYTDLSLTATPAANHYFVDWAQVRQTDSIPDSAVVSTQAVHSFRIDGDMKLQGNFLHNPYVLTLVVDTLMGVIDTVPGQLYVADDTVAGRYIVMADSTVSVAAAALTGYHLTGWQNAQSTQNTPSNPNDLITDTVLVKMTKDSTVSVYFDTNIYNVMLTVQNDERTSQAMGTVTGADSVKHFLTDTLTATAEYGYTFKGWYDADTNLVSALDTLVISPVSDTALLALFTVNEYAVNGLVLDTLAGYVKGSDSVAYLDTVVLRAYANTGYHFEYWQDTTGLQLGAADTLQIIVEGDSTVYAVFDTNHYHLVVKVDSASTGFGSVSGSDSVARHFVDYVINATADSGYHFVMWSNGSTKAIDTVSLVSDSTIAAIFDTNVYNLNVVVADSCTGFGTVTGDSLAKHFLSYDISAKANPGYHFVKWSDSVTDAVRTVSLTSDTTIAAIFDYNPSLTLDYREARGDVQFIVESDTVRFQGITVDNLRTGIVSVEADSADAMGISLKNGKTMTIATNGSAVITQVAFHLTNGTNKAQLITADAGTVNATTGNAYGTVVDIRRDTVVISSTSDKDINIDQLTIQYASELPDGVVRLESDGPNVYRVDYHTTVNLLAVPNDDSYLINWAGDTVRTAGLTAVVTVDSADVTVTANFSGNPVVTLIANGHGRVYFEGYNGYTVNRNEEVLVTNFTDFPHTWYEASTITEINDTTGMVTKDQTNHYVSVHGAFNGTATVVTTGGSFTVTCIPTVPNGVEVMSLDTYTMEPGTVITVKGEPESEYYYLASWSDTAMADSVRSVTVTRDTNLVANFLHFPYVLTLKADTVRGAASVVDSQAYVSVLTDSTYSVMADSVVALAVAPNASYHFVSWMEADSVYSTKADTSVVAGSDRTLTATFDTNVYEVLIAVAEADSIKGFVTNTPDSVKHYLSATYYATPDTGYHFTSWVNAAGTVVSSKDTLVVSPVSDTALYATFDTNVYVLTVLAADTAQGSVTGSDSTAKHFVEYEISATAANCYYFTKWSDGDSTNPRMVTLTSDSVITAQFAYIPRVGYDTIEKCDSVMWNDSVYYVSGDYEKVLQTTGGCDSTAKLHLTIKKSTSSVTTVTKCESYTWHDITYTMSTLAHFDTINAVGCDSIANLDLTIHYNSVSDTTVVTCDSVYRWNGITYVTSTIGTWSTTDVNGCDSTATLYLTLNNNFSGIDERQACESFTWVDSVTYTESTDSATYVYRMANGCDSTVTLHLTISNNLTTTDVQTACESYTWVDGVTYTESTATPTYVYHLSSGCDSTVTLDLTVTHSVTNAIVDSTCSYYIWDGTYYDQSGEYSKSYPAANGCDSVVTLTLTVNQPVTVSVSESACDSYLWNGIEYAASGAYTQHFTGSNGCDSTVNLTLTVKQSAKATVVVTAGDSYEWNGTVYTESGVYTDTTIGSNGCDSVTTLMLTLTSAVNTSVTIETCDSCTWNGSVYTESGVYTYSHPDGYGNTQVDTLHLTIKHSVESSAEVAACNYHIWDGTYYNESGVYSKRYTAANGCDSIATLSLTINQPVTVSVSESACDSYMWNGIEYAASGAYTQHFTGGNGCDSTVNLTLTVKQSKSATVVASACNSYEWHGTVYTATPAVAPTYTTVGSNGCDSVTTLQLTVKKSTTGVETVEACDSYEWHGTVYTASNNTATYHTTNAAGCDSTVTLHLTIKKGVTYSFADTACQSYNWDGNYYNQSGSYSKHYTAANGCDSTATLNLTINQAVTASISASACGSYTWNEVNYATSGVYTQTLDGSNGCDSIVTLTLTVKQPTSATVVASACDSYEWHGETYTETPAVAPTYTTEGANGCDSVTTLQLVIVHSGTSVDNVEACDSYTWIDGVTYTASTNEPTYTITGDACNVEVTLNLTIKHSVEYSFNDTACSHYIWDGTYYNESGSYSQSYTAANGCDSTATLTLVINQQVTADLNESVCGSYTWNEQTYTASGVYSQTFAGSNGCDSVVTLTLIVKQPTSATVVASACDSYEWHGETYTATPAVAPTYTTTGSNGCDSVTTLQLTVRQSTTGVETVEACDSYEWHGTVYTASNNTATYHTNNVAGCDSTVTLNLTIKQSVENSFDTAACTYYIWGGTYYNESGVYSKTYVAANGCDSVVTLTLTVNQPVTTGLTETACGSYSWNGIEYAASGAYSQSFTGVNGCDSTVTLTLTVKQPKTATVSASACGSYTWNGSVYTASGNYSYTTEGSNGCDSTVTLQLTINNPVHMAETEMACGSYSWHGSVYTTSGDYTYSHIDNNGCTQVDTLHLTIHTPVHTAETEVACSSYIWNGTAYSASGDYYYSHIDNNGCTQVDTLHLTIHQPVTVSVSEMACGSYAWNGSVYTASGSYSYTTEGSNGCDSTVILQLTINNPVHTAETKVACGSYTWNGSVYSESGDYTYSHLDNNGCTQVDTLHLTIGNSVNEDETVINCDSYEWNGRMYTESGDYSYSTTTVAGCDSTVTLHLTINHSAESSFDTLSTGSFVWNGETFTESGTYVRTLTTVTGCDSVVTMNLVILPEGFVMPYLYNLMDVMLSVNHNEEGMENVNYVWYRWYRDGEMVLEGPDHDSYSEGGNRLNGCYYVEVAVDGNMEYWVRSNTVCIGTVGIGDVEEIEFTVAPNPVMHGSMVKVSVEGTDLQGAEIRVYDLQGRMVLQQKDNDIIEAPQASGMYMVRLTLNDGRSAVKRLIVK